MVTTKSKLQMEFNKEVTSASFGLVYVCFGSFVKWSSRGGSGTRPPKIGKKYDFWREIVIFHTKYPKKFRASLRLAIFF
jgi:hypothetical protein